MKTILVGAVGMICMALMTPASALPASPASGLAAGHGSELLLVKGGHGHGGFHMNRGRHLGWYRGHHRGWAHARRHWR